jgi:dihydrofolate synthase / folylpolyglutamate synthase
MARRCGSPVHDVRSLSPMHKYENVDDGSLSVYRLREDGGTRYIRSDLLAPVHRWNVAAARLAVRQVSGRFPVSDETFAGAMLRAGGSGLFHARFERLSPELPWYFDGAHNPEAVRELITAIRKQDWAVSPVMVLSLMKDKAQKKCLNRFLFFRKTTIIGWRRRGRQISH